MRGYEQRYSDLKTHAFSAMIEVGEPDFFPVDDLNKIQPEETCSGCALRGPCPGLYRGYHAIYGAEELSRVTGAEVSNSFHWIYEGLTEAPEDVCPLRDGALGVTPWDRGRHLFVRRGERIARFRAVGRDFSDAQIAAVKHETGQVYLDASKKTAPDDFARDLVKLERSGLCGGCPERDRCTGMFEPVFEDVFGRDDARVRELIGTLEGEVLDVGCGEGPYEDVLAPLAQDGRIRYLGVDPDAGRVEALRARWPWARVEVGSAESLDGAHARRFDHVLVLRSWNHLHDPDAALARLVRMMKLRATLTVADNVAFGLARMPAQVAGAESSAARFEHYRNDAAEDAHRRIAPFGLELLERRDVGPATSNQWLLRYRLT
jgi:2-polyprenyl-3-methyl-5-hydroxy-6-metoxy-1,4-benzoquinol methylase